MKSNILSKEEEEANKMTKEEQIGRLLRPGYTYRLIDVLKIEMRDQAYNSCKFIDNLV